MEIQIKTNKGEVISFNYKTKEISFSEPVSNIDFKTLVLLSKISELVNEFHSFPRKEPTKFSNASNIKNVSFGIGFTNNPAKPDAFKP